MSSEIQMQWNKGWIKCCKNRSEWFFKATCQVRNKNQDQENPRFCHQRRTQIFRCQKSLVSKMSRWNLLKQLYYKLPHIILHWREEWIILRLSEKTISCSSDVNNQSWIYESWLFFQIATPEKMCRFKIGC